MPSHASGNSIASPDLFLSLREAAVAGTLTLEVLRGGVTQLADALCSDFPKGIEMSIKGHVYRHPTCNTSGLTRDGRALGQDVYLPYQGRLPRTDPNEMLAFLDEYPLLMRQLADVLAERAEALQSASDRVNDGLSA